MYSYLTFKATRKPQIAKAGLTKEEAIAAAGALYEHTKLLADHQYVPSGVCILVLTDDMAASVVAKGILPPMKELGDCYQCGGF